MTVKPPTEPRRISVAIVDDDASVRMSLQRFCEAFGLTATVYASGQEFIAALDAKVPRVDCLLLDAHMPDMTGVELQRHLIMAGVHIPTVVFTADDAPEVPGRYVAYTIAAFLRKPLSGEELLAAIERAVRGGV